MVVLVAYAKASLPSEETGAPQPTDAWSIAYGIKVCDEWLPSLTGTADELDESWSFHCTRIADGTRTINVGTWVTFDVVPGPTGLEAVALRRRN